MSKRDVASRYRGSILGLVWSFLNPLFMLVIYTFVFAVVFQARWGSGPENKMQFALILFAGLIVHSLLAENLVRAPSMILSNVNFVKRVVFPLEILPWVNMLSASFHTAVSFVVLFVFYLFVHRWLPWTVIFLPLVLFPLVLVVMGLSWFFASLGVYIRDIGQVVAIGVTLLLFLSPVFYPISRVPGWFRAIIYLNPLTFMIQQTRAVVLFGELPDFVGLGIYLACALLIAWLGFAWFQKSRKGFADVV